MAKRLTCGPQLTGYAVDLELDNASAPTEGPVGQETRRYQSDEGGEVMIVH